MLDSSLVASPLLMVANRIAELWSCGAFDNVQASVELLACDE